MIRVSPCPPLGDRLTPSPRNVGVRRRPCLTWELPQGCSGEPCGGSRPPDASPRLCRPPTVTCRWSGPGAGRRRIMCSASAGHRPGDGFAGDRRCGIRRRAAGVPRGGRPGQSPVQHSPCLSSSRAARLTARRGGILGGRQAVVVGALPGGGLRGGQPVRVRGAARRPVAAAPAALLVAEWHHPLAWAPTRRGRNRATGKRFVEAAESCAGMSVWCGERPTGARGRATP